MRIALLQLNQRLGDPAANGACIESAYAKAVTGGAELVVTPELAMAGYLAEDRMWEAGLRNRVGAESMRLSKLSGSVPLVFGTFSPSPSGRLFNELWWCQDGGVRQVIRKRLLPSYDVFEEHRWFEPSPGANAHRAPRASHRRLHLRGSLGGSGFSAMPVRYACNPIADLAKAGATASQHLRQPDDARFWLPRQAAPWAIPSKNSSEKRIGLANMVPLVADRVGASWLLFDGGSCLVQPVEAGRAARVSEGIVWLDTEAIGSPWPAIERRRLAPRCPSHGVART